MNETRGPRKILQMGPHIIGLLVEGTENDPGGPYYRAQVCGRQERFTRRSAEALNEHFIRQLRREAARQEYELTAKVYEW